MPLTVRRVSGSVSTDDILPARYKHLSTDPAVLSAHVFEAMVPGLATRLDGSIIVGDAIFGLGSSREQAVTSLRAAGVAAVAAPAFGRIFYRNCWNNGLPAIECDLGGVADGAEIELDLDAGTLEASGATFDFPAPTGWIRTVVDAGGLLAWVKENQRG